MVPAVVGLQDWGAAAGGGRTILFIFSAVWLSAEQWSWVSLCHWYSEQILQFILKHKMLIACIAFGMLLHNSFGRKFILFHFI